eukprot:3580139-Prymnesium_polylepis.1
MAAVVSKKLVIQYHATDYRARGQSKSLTVRAHNDALLTAWCTALRAAVVHMKRPRMLPSIQTALCRWMRDCMQAADREHRGFVLWRRAQLVCYAANLRQPLAGVA